MDKRALKGEATQKKILQATLEIIATQGITAVSAAKVAQSAAISKSNIFHHFQSVNDILTATLHMVTEVMLGALEEKNVDSLASILNGYESALFTNDTHARQIEKAFFAFYNEGLFNPVYKKIITDFLTVTTHTLTDALMAAKVSEKKADHLSKLLVAVVDGLAIQMTLTDSKETYYQLWLEFKNILMIYIAEDC